MTKYARKIRQNVSLKNIGVVDFSVSLRANPMNENDPHKAYANLQYADTVKLEQLASHILEHGSPYTRDMIVGCTTALIDCIKEFCTSGYKVEVGDLGTFKLSIAQKGAKDLDSFNADTNIEDAWLEYEPSGYFAGLRDKISFNKVVLRSVQQVAERLYKSGKITSKQWNDILAGKLDISLVTPEAEGGDGDGDGDGTDNP